MPRINQLPAASSVESTDVVAIDTQDKTYRVPKSTLFDGYYTAAEVDEAIAQLTANLMKSGTWTPVIPRATIATLTRATWYRTGNLVFASATFTTGALPSGVSASDNVYIEHSSYPTGGGTGVADTSVVDGVWENATSSIGGIIASSSSNNNGWFFGTILTTDYETHRLRADKLVNSTVTIHLRYAVNV